MKKLVANHKLTQKIFLSIIIVLLLSFAVPVKSQAGVNIGGLLLDAVFDLFGTILDVVIGGLQAFLVDGEFSNSDGSAGFLNFFLADREEFMSKIDDEYREFKYSTGNGESQVQISEEELDNNDREKYLCYSSNKIFTRKNLCWKNSSTRH